MSTAIHTMINYIKQRIALLAAAFVAFTYPLVSFAQIKYTIRSPLDPSVTTIEGLLVSILNIFIIVATPIIVIAIIYAGFMYVTAKGNAQQVEKATRALTYAIIGGVILLGAVAIAEIIKGIVDAFSA